LKKNILLLFFLIIYQASFSQISICSWNLKDFGNSKNETEIEFIANTIKSFDVIAIQEVVASLGGSQAVARLSDALNRKGEKWDYIISDPTTSFNKYSVERYAFIWKTSKLKKLGDGWLDQKYHELIDREPYFIRFQKDKKKFTLVNFHAIPKSKQPETEIKYFKFLPQIYPNDNLIFCGDFNLPQSNSVFIPLKKMGYSSSLKGTKTSLRQKCLNDDCLASEYDNFFFDATKNKFISSNIIPFFLKFKDFKSARLISDHVPIYFKFSVN
jgi:endonuclease/exonuclease/phosphatase family metal-dependent hydrolase